MLHETDELAAAFDEDARRRFLGGNARDLFAIDDLTEEQRAACTRTSATR